PVVLGRAYTVTDEYEIRIQRHQRVRCAWPCDYVLAPGDVDRVIPGRERDAASCRVRMPRVDGDALSKSASRRLEADEGELRRDVARCQPATGGARCAPLQQIVGEKREVPADAGRGNRASRGRRERLRRILCAAGERQREQEDGRQRDANHGSAAGDNARLLLVRREDRRVIEVLGVALRPLGFERLEVAFVVLARGRGVAGLEESL